MLDLEEWPFFTALHTPHQNLVKAHRRPLSFASQPPPRHQKVRTRHEEENPQGLMRGQLKRRRTLEDVEGDETYSVQRKKRRLRHSLSTSRLSKPYATPTTYIPSRKALREGIWARQRVVGRNLLRKAAALNSFSKRRRDSQVGVRRSRYYNSSTLTRKSSRSKSPSPHRRSCSPVSSRASSFSDFHIFDFEDETSQEDDSEWDNSDAINSDFSKIEEVELDMVETYGFDSSSTLEMDDIYSFDPGGKGKTIGLIMENERQNEVSLAPGIT